jgi:hypothetical protein
MCSFSLTLSWLVGTKIANVTLAKQDQSENLCSLIMVSTVCYSVSTYFEIFPKNN